MEKATSQMNIRVTPDTAATFREFCKEFDLTQTEALECLLSAKNLETAGSELYDVPRLKQQIRDLEAEAKALEKKNAEIGRHERGLRRVLINFARELVAQARKRGAAPSPRQPMIKPLAFSTSKSIVKFSSFHYPPGSGCIIFNLEYLIYGKGYAPALFIMGTSETGERVKFRWYPRKDYVGITPKHNDHARYGSEWIAIYAQSADGAAEMIASVPLAIFGDAPNPPTGERPSLDDLINNAAR